MRDRHLLSQKHKKKDIVFARKEQTRQQMRNRENKELNGDGGEQHKLRQIMYATDCDLELPYSNSYRILSVIYSMKVKNNYKRKYDIIL